MSDLQIGLLVIGTAIVAAVLLFNWIQERRFRKQAGCRLPGAGGRCADAAGAVPRENARPGRTARANPSSIPAT